MPIFYGSRAATYSKWSTAWAATTGWSGWHQHMNQGQSVLSCLVLTHVCLWAAFVLSSTHRRVNVAPQTDTRFPLLEGRINLPSVYGLPQSHPDPDPDFNPTQDLYQDLDSDPDFNPTQDLNHYLDLDPDQDLYRSKSKSPSTLKSRSRYNPNLDLNLQ